MTEPAGADASRRRTAGPSQRWFPLALIAICAVGVALELVAMRFGPAVRGDSVRYIMGARNLLDGNGFSRLSGGWEVFPETGFAPLLSFVLAGFGMLGIDMVAGARLMNALLFGGSLFLVGTMIERVTRTWWPALLGTVLVLTAPIVFEWHAWLMSESLFVFLMLLGVFALVVHIQSGRMAALVLAAAAVGAASLARYVGVSLVPAGALAILLWGQGTVRRRVGRAALFAVLAALPFVLWMARNSLVGGEGLANRRIRYHPIRPEMLRVLLFQPTTWVLPEFAVLPRTVRGLLAILVLLGGPALLLLEIRRWPSKSAAAIREGRVVLPLSLMIEIPLYLGILAVNSLFLDAGTTYDAILRYLMPLFILTVILEVTAYFRGFPTGRLRRPMAALIAIVVAALLIGQVGRTLELARRSSGEMGFTRIRQDWTDLAGRLSAQGPDEPIITDNPEMVYYLIDRPAYTMPIKFDQYQQAFRQDYQQQLDLARERLQGGAILVVFGPPSEEESEVLDRLQASVLQTFPGAVVYGYPG